jgi:predicted metal-dependent HD superfamily phosphohydrolase
MPARPDGAASRDLARSWSRAWAGIGAGGDGGDLERRLLAAYSEPQRRYHTLQHLHECLALFAPVERLAAQPAELALALWFHDAVYDVRRSDNEERSAEWARSAMSRAGVDAAAVERIGALVMATGHRAVPTQVDEQLLVDIDLAILGAPPRRFAQYEEQIRAEYRHVPRPSFAVRRRAILGSFLERGCIYATPYFRARCEASARANLARAVAAVLV